MAACLHIMFPCGVNSVPNKLVLIKGVVGAEIPVWVYSAPNFPLWALPTPHVAICEEGHRRVLITEAA